MLCNQKVAHPRKACRSVRVRYCLLSKNIAPLTNIHSCQEAERHAGVSFESCFAPEAQFCSLSHLAPFPTRSQPLISLIRTQTQTCPAGRPASNVMRMKLPWKRGRMSRRNFPGRLPEEAGDMVLCAWGFASCSPSQGVRGGHRSPGGQRGGPQGQVSAVADLFPDTSMPHNTEPVPT